MYLQIVFIAGNETCGDIENEPEVSNEEIDWFIDQHPYEEPKLPLDAPKYGFANQRSGVIDRLQVRKLHIYFICNLHVVRSSVLLKDAKTFSDLDRHRF